MLAGSVGSAFPGNRIPGPLGSGGGPSKGRLPGGGGGGGAGGSGVTLPGKKGRCAAGGGSIRGASGLTFPGTSLFQG
jgi:hypothetical protein